MKPLVAVCCSCLTLAVLMGCGSLAEPYGVTRAMEGGSPAGTPAFRSGWRDGCTSGKGVGGAALQKQTYPYTFQPAYVTDEEYVGAWHMGFNHCRWYTSAWLRRMG